MPVLAAALQPAESPCPGAAARRWRASRRRSCCCSCWRPSWASAGGRASSPAASRASRTTLATRAAARCPPTSTPRARAAFCLRGPPWQAQGSLGACCRSEEQTAAACSLHAMPAHLPSSHCRCNIYARGGCCETWHRHSASWGRCQALGPLSCAAAAVPAQILRGAGPCSGRAHRGAAHRPDGHRERHGTPRDGLGARRRTARRHDVRGAAPRQVRAYFGTPTAKSSFRLAGYV